MTAYLLLNHVLSFLAPAANLALLLVLLSRIFTRFLTSNKPLAQSVWAQVAISFIVNTLVLTAGLVLFGNDGKMLTYAAMAVAAAVCQWVLLQGWRGWRV